MMLSILYRIVLRLIMSYQLVDARIRIFPAKKIYSNLFLSSVLKIDIIAIAKEYIFEYLFKDKICEYILYLRL